MLSRRKLLKNGFLLTAAANTDLFQLFERSGTRMFKVGACDWSIGKSSDPAAFDVAKEIGLQGIMVNMGSAENNMHLRDPAIQKTYLEASQRTGVKISSLALGELNKHPYKSEPQTEEWVWDSIDVAKNLGITVILVAFFDKNDLRNDEAGMKEVIRRLKKVAPKAEKMGITLGIESYLDAAGHLRIMDEVGSSAIKAYVDFRNTANAGYDVLKEVKLLGKKNICELHMKENGFLLGQGTLPWQAIRDMLYEMEYYGDGWMQIEGSTSGKSNIISDYKQNLAFLKNLFSKKI
jgi:L-ribulose-5-phosphate 3-epimerase